MRFFAAILIVFLSLLPTPTAEASTWPDEQNKVCVEVRIGDKYWGINNAIDNWNAVAAGQPKFYRAAECPKFNSVLVKAVYLPAWRYGGLTTTTIDYTGDTLSVLITLNNYSGHGLTTKRLYHWRRYASTHEFGHALGLYHNNVNGSVMCYCTDYYKNNGNVSAYDRSSLKAIYS